MQRFREWQGDGRAATGMSMRCDCMITASLFGVARRGLERSRMVKVYQGNAVAPPRLRLLGDPPHDAEQDLKPEPQAFDLNAFVVAMDRSALFLRGRNG